MRLVLPVTLIGSLLLALACGGAGSGTTPEATPPAPPPPAPAPPPPPAPPTPTDPAAPAPATTPPAAAAIGPVTCCGNERLDSVLNAYLKLQTAFAKDDEKGVGGYLSSVQGNADAARSKGNLDEATNALLLTLRTEANNALKAKGIAERRKHFKPLSDAMIDVAKAHKGKGDTTVRIANCPMYEGSWLQTGETIANPYYGAEMLTCGSFK